MNQNNEVTLKQIKQIAKQGEVIKAYQLLKDYIQRNHNDIKAINFYKKLKQKVYEINLKKVKEGIKKVDFMWEQERYADLLKVYLELRQYAPQYKKLQKLIEKAYKKHQHKITKQEDSATAKIINTVDGYMKSKKFNNALALLEKSIQTDPQNPLLRKLYLETKRKIIDSKLKANARMLERASIPESYDFVKKLYELEPTYFKIQKLLSKYHAKLKDYYKNQKHIFEKDAKRQIRVLYNTKEYQKAFRATRELLKVNPKSRYAKHYLEKISKKIDEQNFKQAYKKLIKAGV